MPTPPTKRKGFCHGGYRKELSELIIREGMYKLNNISEDKIFKDNQGTERDCTHLPIHTFKKPLKKN